MVVRSLHLSNFRNYASQDLTLPPGLVALTGDNGQGKTNLLEALCVLSTTKSPLIERDRDLIRWEQRQARLEAEIELSSRMASGREGERRHLFYDWRLEGNSVAREMRVGGVPQSAIAQWLGQLQVVAFFPHDLVLITGDPSERRRFLNLELGKTRPSHFADAARYRRVLQQRNALLKYFLDRRGKSQSTSGEPNAGLGTLSEWNRQLVTYGARILEQRTQFLHELAPILAEVHRGLSGIAGQTLTIEYVAGVKNARDESWSRAFGTALEADYDTDLRRGNTQSGPHRDDLVFWLGSMDLRRFGSQGQQRLAVLSLKIALARWVRDTTGESPILLLDDALSELDGTRRALVLQHASTFEQSILTATDETFIHGAPAHVFQVAAGRVRDADYADIC
ncbi:MAG: replication and repair protein RecF [Abditibacteriota bacterium]|nr:replication and repair protein RecF [Abditibacteriota bacterium]